MSKVGICVKCNENRADTITAEEASRETIPDINEAGNDGNASDPNTTSEACEKAEPQKRKQWAREKMLEFIKLYKKYKRKGKAAKEFEARYQFKIKANTYNPWIKKKQN